MLPMPSRADETAALVAVVGNDKSGVRWSSRIVPWAGICLVFVGVVVLGTSAASRFTIASLGQEMRLSGATVGGDDGASPQASSTGCKQVGDDGNCVAYVEDGRACAATTNWRVDSCVHFANGEHGDGETEQSPTEPSKEQWIASYYKCVNGVADDVERPYRVPKTGRGKWRFLQVLAEFEKQLGTRVGAETKVEREGPLPGDVEALLETQTLTNKPLPEPYVWAFIHVPKSAGSYLTEKLRAQMWRLRERGDEAERQKQGTGAGDAQLGGDGATGRNTQQAVGEFFDDVYHPWYSEVAYAPVMDLTEPNFAETFNWYSGGIDGAQIDVPPTWQAPGWIDESDLGNNQVSHLTDGFDENGKVVVTQKRVGTPYGAKQNTPRGMARSFHAGRREIFKGSLAMGFCDVVRAPCAYITVLRDPVDRLLSHHAYSCLAGSEGQAGWTEEMKAAGSCDLDPAAYFEQMGGVEVSVQLLAPRADPSSRCALEQAKANLASPCARFLLQDRLEEGMEKLSESVPGFRGLNEDPPASFVNATYMGADPGMLENGNKIQGRLTDAQAAKVEQWKGNEEMMGRLRKLAAHEIELYEFAVGEYEKQWDRDELGSC